MKRGRATKSVLPLEAKKLLKKLFSLVVIILLATMGLMAQGTQTVAVSALVAGGASITVTPLTAIFSVMYTTVGWRDTNPITPNTADVSWGFAGAARAKITLSIASDFTPVITGHGASDMLECNPNSGFVTNGTVVTGAFPGVGPGKIIWTSTNAMGSFTAGTIAFRFQTFPTVPPATYTLNAVLTIASTI